MGVSLTAMIVQLCEKCSITHESVACTTCFSSNKLKLIFSVRLYQSFTSLWIFLTHSALHTSFSSFRVVINCLCTALLRSHHIISVKLRSGFWLGHFNMLAEKEKNHPAGHSSEHLGKLSCWMTQFQPRFSCRTDGLTFDSGIFWYAEFIVY